MPPINWKVSSLEAFLKKHEHSITTFSIVYSVSILLLYCFLADVPSLTSTSAEFNALSPNGQRGLTGLILYGICLAIGLTRKSHCLLRRLSVITVALSPLIPFPSIDTLLHPTSYLLLIANLPVSGIFVLFLNYLRLNAHHAKPSLFFYGASIFFGGFCSVLFCASFIATLALVACAMNFIHELRLMDWNFAMMLSGFVHFPYQ